MKINCHNTFDPLKEAILGSVSTTLVNSIENKNKKEIIQDIINDTIEDLDNIQKILNSFGVKVHRPNCEYNFSKHLTTPSFDIQSWHVPLCPRDLFFTYEDILVITGAMEHNRYFEHHCYEDIVTEYFDDGSHVVAMPQSALSNSVYENVDQDFEFVNNNFPMFAAANLTKYGRDIFVNSRLSANNKGIEWIKRQMGQDYRYHFANKKTPGHIDGIFNILKPGVVSSVVPKQFLPDFFDSWDVICMDDVDPRRLRTMPELVTDDLQDDDFEGTFLGYNIFSIDQENILISESAPVEILKKLEKHKFNIIFADLRHTNFLNQGLTCITLDTVRDGNLDDYS